LRAPGLLSSTDVKLEPCELGKKPEPLPALLIQGGVGHKLPPAAVLHAQPAAPALQC
jgi:hypothetical protein